MRVECKSSSCKYGTIVFSRKRRACIGVKRNHYSVVNGASCVLRVWFGGKDGHHSCGFMMCLVAHGFVLVSLTVCDLKIAAIAATVVF